MIALHRINHPDHEFFLSPDLFLAIEANPDTVITLTNGSKYVVAEAPGEVARLVQEWRSGSCSSSPAPARRPERPRLP